MTTLEVCEEIRSRGKSAYMGVMPMQTFYATLTRIEISTAMPSTIQKFFYKFLFSGEGNFWFDINATQELE